MPAIRWLGDFRMGNMDGYLELKFAKIEMRFDQVESRHCLFVLIERDTEASKMRARVPLLKYRY